MQTDDFDFELPPELIAQTPAPERDQSRLLVLSRDAGKVIHQSFQEFPEQLQNGEVLVLNNSRVVPARLRGINARTRGRFEVLLLEENDVNDWWVMLKPGKRAREGTEINLRGAKSRATSISATVTEINEEGHRRLHFSGVRNIRHQLELLGEAPLPPYIARAHQGAGDEDKARYQTVYAAADGSVAAPTAGLHFTDPLLAEIRARGVRVCFVTLHVGLGTFAPVKSKTPEGHAMHEERYEVPEETAHAVNEAKLAGRRVIAVGTTTTRVLESVAAQNGGRLVAGVGRTRIFIYPPYTFRIVDALLTNFHLPRSTLLMLVSAFASPGDARGRELVLAAYTEAVRERYRFYSYGDAMLIF